MGRLFLAQIIALLMFVCPGHQLGYASSLSEQARGILAKNCLGCHGATTMSGLDLRQRDGLLKGGTRGPALVPGDAKASLLYQSVAQLGDLKMPAGQDPLSARDIETLREGLKQGQSGTPRSPARPPSPLGGPFASPDFLLYPMSRTRPGCKSRSTPLCLPSWKRMH